MNTDSAIASVTAALRTLLDAAATSVGGTNTTILPPDKVTEAPDEIESSSHLNLFLYQVSANAAWRNLDMPFQTRPGETAPPPVPVTLYYLLTAYGTQDHKLLGAAMRVLNDQPLVNYRQVERVRVTFQPMSVDEMSKLWTSFQAKYRISVAFQVSVVLIESQGAGRAALPVLRRGSEDQGPVALAGGSPTLDEIVLPRFQASALPGDVVVLRGVNLNAAEVKVRFQHVLLDVRAVLTPAAGEKEGELNVTLPGTPADLQKWVPGFYRVSLEVQRPNLPVWTTNELPVALAPRITRSPATVTAGGALTVTSLPRVRETQRVLLVLSGQQVTPDSITNSGVDLTAPSEIAFTVPALTAGTYPVRLRVDGVDSIPVIRTGTPPRPQFDPDQQVTV